LPADFKASVAIHNGQDIDSGQTLMPLPSEPEAGYRLMTLDHIATEWQMWMDLIQQGEFAGQESSADEEILADTWWQPGWIPFAENGGGDSFCLDLTPSRFGKVGQIITMNHESSRRELLASSFSEWLAELADKLEGN
jgi:cell wall assembly regulator SMI1